ncbi:MAG: hypothetical protein JXR10_04490 [Cyclobacteriaceae bacterium]
MKKMLLVPLMLFFGCDEISDDLSGIDASLEMVKNVPVISNVGNVYSLVVNAEGFSMQDSSDVKMDSSLVLSIAVADYTSGSMRFSVFAEDSSIVFDRMITSSIVISEFPPSAARSISMIMEDFSGKVSLSLTEGE